MFVFKMQLDQFYFYCMESSTYRQEVGIFVLGAGTFILRFFSCVLVRVFVSSRPFANRSPAGWSRYDYYGRVSVCPAPRNNSHLIMMS